MSSIKNTFTRTSLSSYSQNNHSDNGITTNYSLPITIKLNINNTDRSEYYRNLHKNFCNHHQLNNRTTAMIEHGQSFVFWSVIVVLLILTVGNLMLILSIIGVLHFGKSIYGLEMILDKNLIKFYGQTDLDDIYLKNPQLESFVNKPLMITGENAQVLLRLQQRNGQTHSRMIMDRDTTLFRNVNIFEIKDLASGTPIFSTHKPRYNINSGIRSLISKSASTSRIASGIGQGLLVSTPDNPLALRGSEGIYLDASSAFVQAEKDVYINSTKGALLFQANAGIFLHMDKLPIVHTELGLRTAKVQYKLCVCMPDGILFRIAIPRMHNTSKVSCSHFNINSNDPCAY